MSTVSDTSSSSTDSSRQTGSIPGSYTRVRFAIDTSIAWFVASLSNPPHAIQMPLCMCICRRYSGEAHDGAGHDDWPADLAKPKSCLSCVRTHVVSLLSQCNAIICMPLDSDQCKAENSWPGMLKCIAVLCAGIQICTRVIARR